MKQIDMKGEKEKYVIKHGYCPKKMPQIDEKRKGETGNGLRKVQRKQTWGSQRAGR